MSPRKGGIGRRPGKNRSSRQKSVSNRSIILKDNNQLIPLKNRIIKVSVDGLLLSLESKDDEMMIKKSSMKAQRLKQLKYQLLVCFYL